jgi:hypothetical protein
MITSSQKNLEKNYSSESSDKAVLEKITRSLLRKIRENESATKKDNLKPIFRELLEKANF